MMALDDMRWRGDGMPVAVFLLLMVVMALVVLLCPATLLFMSVVVLHTWDFSFLCCCYTCNTGGGGCMLAKWIYHLSMTGFEGWGTASQGVPLLLLLPIRKRMTEVNVNRWLNENETEFNSIKLKFDFEWCTSICNLLDAIRKLVACTSPAFTIGLSLCNVHINTGPINYGNMWTAADSKFHKPLSAERESASWFSPMNWYLKLS